MEFKIGDRVRVKREETDHFIQPWRERFEKGRLGTVVQLPSSNVRGFLVYWDHGKVRWPREWEMVMSHKDIEKIEE